MRLAAAMHCPGSGFRSGNIAGGCRHKLLRAGGLGLLIGVLAGSPAAGQAPQPSPQPLPAVGTRQPQAPAVAARQAPAIAPRPSQRTKLNRDTLIVAASRPGTTYLAMADDLSAAVDADASVRVLPVAGDGGPANVRDALFLRGLDMAIVPANVLADANASKAFGGGLARRLSYVAVLYGEEVHVLAAAGFAAVGDLRGKRVAVPAEDGTAQFTQADIFRRLGIAVEVVPMAPDDALEEVRAGTVAAAVVLGGKPVAQVSALPKDGSVRLLSLPFPVLPGDSYAPAVLLPEDYPALIPPGAIVETVAVSAVLMTKRGSEGTARRIAKHTPAVLDAITKLATSGRHPKWKDVNLGAVLPGWSRVPAAEEWLRRALAERKRALEGTTAEPTRPSTRVKSSQLSTPRHKKLLDEFDAWARKSAASGEAAGK